MVSRIYSCVVQFRALGAARGAVACKGLALLASCGLVCVTPLVLGSSLAQVQHGHGLAAAAPSARARPLFINLTSDDGHRSRMAIGFGANQLQMGHPLTIYLNDRGVFLASRLKRTDFADQQQQLNLLQQQGAQILVCPMCMKHYGVESADLIPAARPSNPQLANQALFQPGSVSLSW